MDVMKIKFQCDELKLILESLRRPLDLRTRTLLMQKFKLLINKIQNEVKDE